MISSCSRLFIWVKGTRTNSVQQHTIQDAPHMLEAKKFDRFEIERELVNSDEDLVSPFIFNTPHFPRTPITRNAV